MVGQGALDNEDAVDVGDVCEGEFGTGGGVNFADVVAQNGGVMGGGEDEPVGVLLGGGVEAGAMTVPDKARIEEELKLFRPREAVAAELERLRLLREEHPEYAAQVVLQGESMVELAAEGALDALATLAVGCREGELLAWTSARMFKAACVNGRLSVVRFMAENGVTKHHPGLRHLLHELVQGDEDEALLVKVIPVLVNECGFDVNSMRRGDGVTPLHLACDKPSLTLFKVLVLLKADIHAIANDNSLPLTRAFAAAQAATTSAAVIASGEIVKYLQLMGASDTVSLVSSTG